MPIQEYNITLGYLLPSLTIINYCQNPQNFSLANTLWDFDFFLSAILHLNKCH